MEDISDQADGDHMLLRQWVPDDIPHMKWKIKFMFESSKQISQICIYKYYIYNYGKSPCLMGKSTINGQFSIAMLN